MDHPRTDKASESPYPISIDLLRLPPVVTEIPGYTHPDTARSPNENRRAYQSGESPGGLLNSHAEDIQQRRCVSPCMEVIVKVELDAGLIFPAGRHKRLSSADQLLLSYYRQQDLREVCSYEIEAIQRAHVLGMSLLNTVNLMPGCMSVSTLMPIECLRMKSRTYSWSSPLSDRRLQRHHDPGNIVRLDNLMNLARPSVMKPLSDASEAIDEIGISGVPLVNSW
jgi:hypothetical protein